MRAAAIQLNSNADRERTLAHAETLVRAAGSEIDPEPYVRYLKGKLGEVAGVAVS